MIYKPRHQLWHQQAEGLKQMHGKAHFALLMAMRTGKTATLLTDWGMLVDKGKCQDLMVIAPAAVYKTWLSEIDTHIDTQLRPRINILLWEASVNNQRSKRLQKQFLEPGKDRPRILLMNVEALSGVERARTLCETFLSQQRRAMVAVDESTVLRNVDSKRSTYIIDKLRPMAAYRRILSGLPAPNSPFDLFAQFYFLDPDILGWSYANYKAHYAEIDKVCMVPNAVLIAKLEKYAGKRFNLPGVGIVEPRDLGRKHMLQELERRKIWVPTIPIIKRFRNEPELHERIAPHSYRVRLEDCYDVPAKIYMKREVELTAEQKRIYQELKANSMAELENEDFVTPTMVITRILRMHQVLCGHVKDDEGKVHEIKENRTAELLATLDDYDGKAIVWCSYDADVRKISAALTKAYGEGSVARFWGGNAKTREDEEMQFKTNPQCRFMVATASAGGRGRTWSIANLLLYYSSTNDLEHRSQSEERGEGVGKMTPMTCLDLLVPGTVDEKIIEALRKKMDMAAVITGDTWRQWLI